MATILTITANPLLDHLAEVALTIGRVHRIKRFAPIAGGKGLNVARVLARHGHRVLAAGFLGGSAGEQIIDLVSADGVEPAFTPISGNTRVGFLLTDPTPGPDPTTRKKSKRSGPTSVMENGPDISAGEIAALVAGVRERLRDVDLVIISGGVPSPNCGELYRLLLDVCAVAQVTCWVDGYGSAMDAALAGVHPPALVKPNRDEYGDDGRRWVVAGEIHLSDGGGEMNIRTPQGRFRVIPPPIHEVNPIGSGDCYVAALAHARLTGLDLISQLRYASAAGAANAARADVAGIGPADIVRLVDLVQVTQIS